MTHYKILASCSVVLENQLFVDSIASTNQVALSNKKVEETVAGKVLTGSRFLTGNHEVFLLSCVGQDSHGKQAIAWLQKNNIKTELMQVTAKDATGQVIVLTNTSGQSATTVYLGAGKHIKPILNLEKYDAFYLDTSIPLSTLNNLLENKPKESISVIDFPNQHRQFDKTMLKHVNFAIPNRYEAELLTDMKITTVEDAFIAGEKLLSFAPQHVIITLDKDGCIILNQNIKQHLSAEESKMVDATGAGDIFRGCFLNHYLETRDVIQSLKFANKVASFSIAIKGLNQSVMQSLQKFF